MACERVPVACIWPKPFIVFLIVLAVFWAISVCAGNDGYDGLKLATHFRWDPHNPNANKNSTTGIGEINYVAKYIS